MGEERRGKKRRKERKEGREGGGRIMIKEGKK